MAGRTSGREVEIKVRVGDLARIEERLTQAGFKLLQPHCFEGNALYDFDDTRLGQSGCALRLRLYGGTATLTFKGPKEKTRHVKAREEIETVVGDIRAVAKVFRRIGLRRVFLYEKYRKILHKKGMTAALDQTPMGPFLEIEGNRNEILREARRLGFGSGDFIRESYVELFRSQSKGDMVFRKKRPRRPGPKKRRRPLRRR